MDRRKFNSILGALGGAVLIGKPAFAAGTPKPAPVQNPRFRNKVSLNAYSFDKPLKDGTMTVFDMIDFCAKTGFDAVDITAYYLKGYPVVPPDAYLYSVKKHAFRAGIEISGTGVRNDFTYADPAARQKEVQLVKDWIIAAEKMGAPVIRIFAGKNAPENTPREQVTGWMLKDINECVQFGSEHGVIVAVQNHNDFIRTSEQAIDIVKRINSEWLGLMVDIGSFKDGDAYAHIEAAAPYAVNWQIKEKVTENGVERDVDIPRLLKIIAQSGYPGYLPIETLGEGDPLEKVKNLFVRMTEAVRTFQ